MSTKISQIDRLKEAVMWLGCNSLPLQPTAIALGGKLHREGLAMLEGPDAPPLIKIHSIPIKRLKSDDNSFTFIFKEIK